MSEAEDFEFRLRMEREAAAKVTPEKGFMDQFIKPAVLPTGGAIAGMALGGGIGTPFGMSIPGAIVGGAVGAMAGEAGNQALGLTEPSAANIGLAGGINAVAGGLGAVARPLLKLANPKTAAQVMNAIAPEEVARRLAPMAPVVPAATLFKQATASQGTIPLTKTAHTIDLMLDDLTNVSAGLQKANSQTIGYLKGLKTLIEDNPNGLTPLAMQRELEGTGQMVKSVGQQGGTGGGAIKKVFKSLTADLDDAANVAGGPLHAARTAFKKESVLGEIGDAITNATKLNRGQGGDIQFNANAVIKEIGKNRFYQQALSEGERTEIESTLKLLNKIPSLWPGAGQSYGSGHIASMMRRSAVGGALGGTFAGVPGASVGAAIGAASGPVTEFGRNVAVTLQMQTGRAMLKELLTQSKGVATPQVLSVVAAYAEAVRAGQVHE